LNLLLLLYLVYIWRRIFGTSPFTGIQQQSLFNNNNYKRTRNHENLSHYA